MPSMMRRSKELLEVARLHREPTSTTDVAIRQYLSAIGTPRALTVWLLYKHKEHDQLTELECHAEDYENNPFAFRLDYAATSFLSKASFLHTSFDRKEVALKKFEKFEDLCRETNIRFRNFALDPLFNGPNVWLLEATKQKIARILGFISPDEFVDEANWGPGVTTLIKGECVSAINKFHDERGITRDLYALIEPWFSTAYPLWSSHLSQKFGEKWHDFQVGNNVITVPKNSKTDRVIAVEPGINLWFQKALGAAIRRRLLRVGIDLNSQSKNQQLSLIGSCFRPFTSDGSNDIGLATVDFSSASDSISLEVVRELLPPRWFQLLDACRSHYGVSSNGPRKWEKFSSMGNGFTFELESLIFFAAAQAVAEYTGSPGVVDLTTKHGRPFVTKSERINNVISVFGDDVIIPRKMFSLFSSFSEFLGFKVNGQKSFSDGYFRESCGSHYYDGIDVKPIFLKERLRNVEAIYKLANSVRHLAHRHNSHYGCDARFLHCWRYLLERVPEPLRFFVPASAGDVGLVGNFDEAQPSRARYGIEGYMYRALTSLGVNRESESPAVLLARLWVASVQEYRNTYTLRGRTRRKISDSLTVTWYNLGPWL